jgi:hypothetical protein
MEVFTLLMLPSVVLAQAGEAQLDRRPWLMAALAGLQIASRQQDELGKLEVSKALANTHAVHPRGGEFTYRLCTLSCSQLWLLVKHRDSSCLSTLDVQVYANNPMDRDLIAAHLQQTDLAQAGAADEDELGSDEEYPSSTQAGHQSSLFGRSEPGILLLRQLRNVEDVKHVVKLIVDAKSWDITQVCLAAAHVLHYVTWQREGCLTAWMPSPQTSYRHACLKPVAVLVQQYVTCEKDDSNM